MGRTLRGSVTIGEVATAAGVSRATVSRVMNDRSTVEPTMARRVRAAAEELRYRPSSVARSLSLGRTNSVAFVVPDLSNPMFQQILRGTMAAAAPHDYRMLVAESPEKPEDEAESALEARLRCDALVLVSPRMTDDALRDLLPQVRPAVLVNRCINESSTPALMVDYATGIAEIIDHVMALGHRDLVYLSGPSHSTSNAARIDALRAAAHRYPELAVRTLRGGSTVDAGYSAADGVLASRATAVIAFNDLVAFGLLARLNEYGVAVPEDISIVGFDDIELARYATPSLTTAAVGHAELGGRAWELLQDVINGDSSGHQRMKFKPRLEIRASTGPVPPGHRATPHSSSTADLPHFPTADERSLAWRLEQSSTILEGPHMALARYELGDRMPQVHAPRPHLHPVRTLKGIALTETSPRDHRHHYGLSIAVADVNGTSHWGGRTFIRDEGPTLLQNHGRQVSGGMRVAGGDATGTNLDEGGSWLVGDVNWYDHQGTAQLREDRMMGGVLLPEADAWALFWHSLLHADHGTLKFDSPATNGRPGAGYGGLFWRLPMAEETIVLTDSGTGEDNAHGSSSPWLAFAQRRADVWTTLVLAQATGAARPWFIRATEYVGAGPALAWDQPLTVSAGETLELDLTAVLVDRQLDQQDAADLADLAASRMVVPAFPRVLA
jgi:LacI family transcriptional regulator